MYFEDSALVKLQDMAALERATVVPEGILPCYIGSGKTVMSVDATGLQGFNNRQQYAYALDESDSASGDMYVLSNGRVSDHISPQNVLPYGYFTWSMDTEKGGVDAGNMALTCAKWERELRLDEGSVATRFLARGLIAAEIKLLAPLGEECVLMRFRTRAHYVIPNGAPPDPEGGRRVRRAAITVTLHMKTRTGKSLYDTAVLEGDTLRVEVAGHEQYRYAVRASASCKSLPRFEDGKLSVSFDASCKSDCYSETLVVFDFAGKYRAEDAANLLERNWSGRQAYFAGISEVCGLDEKESFLYSHSHHLLLSGFDYGKGLTIGAPFFFPDCWRASTFWDSHFVMDALMRCNARRPAEEFLRFLRRALKKEGNPYPWMFLYDGTPTIAKSRDIAPLVVAAHAHTAIKFDEYYGDPDLRAECVYPIVSRCCEFARDRMFARNEDGEYELSMAVSNDVVDEQPDEVNQTFTLVWFLSLFGKYQLLRQRMGYPEDTVIAEILQRHHIENDGMEYYHSRGYTAAAYRWASWIPFLCYPTEAVPLLDADMLKRTCETYSFSDLYLEKQSCSQPWTEFMEANSDFRRGDVEKGYRLRRLGMSHAYGPGMFCEVGAKQWTITVPPYISAHGTYLTALLYQFVATDSWDNRIGLFTAAHADYDRKTVRLRRVRCCGSILVDVTRSPRRLEASVKREGGELNVALELKLPADISPELARLTVNGKPIAYERKGNIVALRLSGISYAEILVY